MAVPVAQFRVRFPEFTSTPESLVSIKLAEAGRRINADVWGTLADDGQAYLAAHLLSVRPAGERARKTRAAPDTESTYLREYKRLLRIVTMGYRVT